MLGRPHRLRRVCGSSVVPVNIYCSRSEPQARVTPATPQSSAAFPRGCISQACEASKPCAEQLPFPHQAAARGSELAGPAQGLLRPPRGGGNAGCPLPRNQLRPRHRGQWLGGEGGPHQPGEPDPGQALASATALSVRNSSSSQNPSLPSPGLGGGGPSSTAAGYPRARAAVPPPPGAGGREQHRSHRPSPAGQGSPAAGGSAHRDPGGGRARPWRRDRPGGRRRPLPARRIPPRRAWFRPPPRLPGAAVR